MTQQNQHTNDTPCFLIGAQHDDNNKTIKMREKKTRRSFESIYAEQYIKKKKTQKIKHTSKCMGVMNLDSGGFLIGDKIMTYQEQQIQQRQRREEKRKALASFKTARYIHSTTTAKAQIIVYHDCKPLDIDEFLIQPTDHDKKTKNKISINIKSNKNHVDTKIDIKMKSKRAIQLQKRWKQLQQQKIMQKDTFKQKKREICTKSCSKKTPIIFFNEFFIREDQLEQ